MHIIDAFNLHGGSDSMAGLWAGRRSGVPFCKPNMYPGINSLSYLYCKGMCTVQRKPRDKRFGIFFYSRNQQQLETREHLFD